jgi:hypothetical protein
LAFLLECCFRLGIGNDRQTSHAFQFQLFTKFLLPRKSFGKQQ